MYNIPPLFYVTNQQDFSYKHVFTSRAENSVDPN